jgi:hypothetical protein
MIAVDDYRRTEMGEHQLQVAVLAHIKAGARPGVFAMALPNAGKRSPQGGQRMKAEGLVAGAPDLVVVLPGGRTAWLELKNGKRGTQSVAQKGMQFRLTALGHPYGLAHTLDEALEFLEKVGALK